MNTTTNHRNGVYLTQEDGKWTITIDFEERYKTKDLVDLSIAKDIARKLVETEVAEYAGFNLVLPKPTLPAGGYLLDIKFMEEVIYPILKEPLNRSLEHLKNYIQLQYKDGLVLKPHRVLKNLLLDIAKGLVKKPKTLVASTEPMPFIASSYGEIPVIAFNVSNGVNKETFIPMPEELLKTMELDVVELMGTNLLLNRFKSEAIRTNTKGSGEELRLAIHEYLEEHGFLILNFNKALSVSYAFLEEAFGGLIRMGYSAKELKEKLVVLNENPNSTRVMNLIVSSILNADQNLTDMRTHAKREEVKNTTSMCTDTTVRQSPEVVYINLDQEFTKEYIAPYASPALFLTHMYIIPALERGSKVILHLKEKNANFSEKDLKEIMDELVDRDIPSDIIERITVIRAK